MSRSSRVLKGALITTVGLLVMIGVTAAITIARINATPAGRLFNSVEEVVKLYPYRDATAAALQLEALTAAVGIDTATNNFEGRSRPVEMDHPDIADIGDAVSTWTRDHIRRSHREIEPPPPIVSAYFERHAMEFAAIRDHLNSGELLRWELQLEKISEAPLPNLIGHRRLQDALLGHVLYDERAGRHAEAAAWLDASWQLNRAIRDDPLLITQQFAMGQHRRQLGVLRQLADPPDYWHDWLAEHDYRASFQDSVTVELWLVPEMFIAEVSGKPGLAGRLTRLYVELCVRHARNRYQRSLRNLSQLEVLCDSDLPNRGAGFDIKLPRWNTFGKLMIIATDKSVERVAQMELEVELTSRLLELNRARREVRDSGDRFMNPVMSTMAETSISCTAIVSRGFLGVKAGVRDASE